MPTARSIIKKALQKNGTLVKGESPDADEAADGLASLNAMISAWSNNSLLIYARLSESFPLVGGQASYTIGPGGDFDTTRPTQILSAFTRIGSTDYDIKIISDVDFDKIIQKNIGNSIPDVLFYNASVPLGIITIYPVPTTGTLHIRSEKKLTEFTTLDTNLDLPPGWERALIYNLAVENAPEYGQELDPLVLVIARDSLNGIKTAVARNKTMDINAYDGQNNNIYTGWYT